MDRLTSTPFGRGPVSAAQIIGHAREFHAASGISIDKWELFGQLRRSHEAFSVSYRSLTVLNALLSFLPSRTLGDSDGLVVFPSNRSLSDRAHGMPESTLRRHLAALLRAGLIRRHDSPNGKRYAARTTSGAFAHAFGFDLAPLLHRAPEIAAAAHAADTAAEEHRRLRERFTLLKRDAAKLSEDASVNGVSGDWTSFADRLAHLQKVGRRKLPLPMLRALVDEAADLLACVVAAVERETPEPSGDDAQNERHIQSSEEDLSEFETTKKKAVTSVKSEITLSTVLHGCREAVSYATEPVRSWNDMIRLAHILREFVGIDGRAWDNSLRILGEIDAAVVLCCMIERLPNIRNPGGYLRSLCRKAALGQLSIPAMLRAVSGDRRVDSCQLA